MAISRLCSIPDCGKPSCARGWCWSHYRRWKKHNDPLAGKTPSSEMREYLNNVVLPYDGDECLMWPFYRDTNGRGILGIGGNAYIVPRLVCIRTHGEPPTLKHQAAHSCGNGHLGCVNPKHLSWKTAVENEADKLVHGTRPRGSLHGRAKLNEDDIRKIRDLLRDNVTRIEIAKRYGVSYGTIRDIQHRRRWAWLD